MKEIEIKTSVSGVSRQTFRSGEIEEDIDYQ